MEIIGYVEEELRKSYLSYALSVIVSRAIPDVRDGLKPVQRRIIYAMKELSLFHNKPHKKSARVVGEVLGKYHPHGDAAIYDALVRMAQDFSLRYVLIDGQGNFGSIDGDPPAAMRYTEVRLTKLAEELIRDIEYDTVDFRKNFDNTLEEPVVLPSRIPNLLINGTSGIAVGMASNIPPHNLNEVIDALLALIEGKEKEEVVSHIKGPDFPTGGIIVGRRGIEEYKHTGRGIIKVRAKAFIKGQHIIITEIPYQVSKAKILEEIAKSVENNHITEIADLIDSSDRRGLHIEIKVKKHYDPQIVLNKLYKHTSLETSYGIIQIALVNGVPRLLSTYDMLKYFLEHRKEVVKRRTQFLLKKDLERREIVEGVLKALESIDKVIEIIKSAENRESAIKGLIEFLNINERQALAILEMRLSTLMNIERQKLENELKELNKRIDYYNRILSIREELLNVIKNELIEIKERYGDQRRTLIEDAEIIRDMEELVQDDEVIIVLSKDGYVKRLSLNIFKTQHRGGVGIKIAKEDVGKVVVCNNKDYLLFFSSKGKVYWKKAYEIEKADRYAKGRHIRNYLVLDEDEEIVDVIPERSFDRGYVLFLTKKGLIKKTSMSAFSNPRKGGIIAIRLSDGDVLRDVKKIDEDSIVLVACKNGYGVMFNSSEVREMGRNSMGVRAIKCNDSVGMAIINDPYILFISEKGYGKRTHIKEFPVHHRGGKGVKALSLKKGDSLKEIINVKENDELLVVTKSGNILRITVKEISLMGRYARGVRVVKKGEEIETVSVIRVK